MKEDLTVSSGTCFLLTEKLIPLFAIFFFLESIYKRSQTIVLYYSRAELLVELVMLSESPSARAPPRPPGSAVPWPAGSPALTRPARRMCHAAGRRTPCGLGCTHAFFSDKNVGTFQKYWSAFYQNTGENVSKMIDPVFPLNKCRCTSFQVCCTQLFTEKMLAQIFV